VADSNRAFKYFRENKQKGHGPEIKSSLHQKRRMIDPISKNTLNVGPHHHLPPSPPPPFSISKNNKVKRKGKHASSTENRRGVWECIVWPLILQINRQYFTLQEYRAKTDEFNRLYNVRPPSSPKFSGGLISLVDKGLLLKNKEGPYSIDYRLIPYIRKKVKLEYGFAAKETYAKQ
jgi:hypothetical protein